jgi:hypothetical protein
MVLFVVYTTLSASSTYTVWGLYVFHALFPKGCRDISSTATGAINNNSVVSV